MKNNGQVSGYYYNTPPEYSADAEMITEVSENEDKKVLFNLVKDYQLYNRFDASSEELFFRFGKLYYLQSDTSEFLYGKWLPANGALKSERSGNIFWLRKVDSSYDRNRSSKIKNIKKPGSKKPPVKSYDERSNIVADRFISHERQVDLEFYDNGVIDGDVISVYVNGQPVIFQRRLTVQPIKLSVPLVAGKECTVTMFAENLGIFPPNTAVMIIHSGYVRKTVFLSADLNSNASVIFERQDIK